MYEKKDSSGREFLAADTVYSLHAFSSPFNFQSSSGDSKITTIYPEACILRTILKFITDFRNEAKSE